MKRFECQACGNEVHFLNTTCVNCERWALRLRSRSDSGEGILEGPQVASGLDVEMGRRTLAIRPERRLIIGKSSYCRDVPAATHRPEPGLRVRNRDSVGLVTSRRLPTPRVTP